LSEYRIGSLFAGVGGVCLGFKKAGYQIVWANEIDEYAAETYRKNFDHELIVGDIEKILRPTREENLEKRKLLEEKRRDILKYPIDILTGGFPCQSFSIAGDAKGFDDHRGNLFWSIIDLVEQLEDVHGKPRVLFLENVKNLKSHDKGRTYEFIKSQLEKIGYSVKEAVINTNDFTRIPQNRERIFIIGFLNKEDGDRFTLFDKDKNGKYSNLEKYKVKKTKEDKKKEIKRVVDFHLTEKEGIEYYYTENKYPKYFVKEKDYLELSVEERKSERINLEEQITEEYEFYQVRRGMYVRKNKNGVCPTLTANMGTGGHNVPLIKVGDGIRKLTPEETFKLQGFPIGNGYELPTHYEGRVFSKGRLYKQAGNSVTVDVIEFLARQLMESLKG
jgi:DNA (cytosine-5)-methyltransferase 1